MKESTYSGSFAVVIAAVLWSFDGLLRRQLFDLPPIVVVFWEHAVGFFILLPIVLVSFRALRQLTRKQWLAMALVAALSGVGGTLMYTAALGRVQFIPFSVVVLLQLLQPLFAIGASRVLLRERMGTRFFGLAAVALVAAYGVSFPDLRVNFGTGDGTLIAALLAVGAAAAWGVSTALSKYSLHGVPSVHVTVVRFGFTALLALALVPVFGAGGSLTALTAAHWWRIVAITFSTGLVALGIYYFGLKRIPASRSTLLELTWPLSAAVIGIFTFNESLSLTQWIAAGILMLIVWLVTRNAKQV
jgi:drug/metabolite transporter (DMT)-like permease